MPGANKPSDEARRLQLLIDAVSDYAICMLDPQGRVENWNSGAERVFGYAADQAMGQPLAAFYAEEARAAGEPQQALDQARTLGRHESEGWRLRRDGSRFWASAVLTPVTDETGTLIGFASITRDITERRAAQDALWESERQFRLLVNGVTDYALFMLDRDGRVVSWNSGARRIKGYSADEIIGQHFSRFYTDTDRSSGAPDRGLARAREQGRYEAEGWRVRRDGSLFWASVVIDAIRDEAGELIGFAKITRDISERREAQLQLQQAHAQLAQAQKMDALGQLTGGVAHDFNNLLMIIGGQAEMLRKADVSPRAMRSIDAIEQATRRGERLTRQLLTFARRQQLQRTRIVLGERIELLRDLLLSSLGESAQLEIDIAPDLWPVELDAGELELALLNLAVNARDAMPDGGVLRISARNETLKAGDFGETLAGDFVALRITDTGMGIPEDILPKVFDPFFTTKRTGKGTGLGLSQVYGFARQAGGTATVESQLGAGTQITLHVPRAEAERSAEVAQADVQAPAAPRQDVLGATILVVEDNPDVAAVSAGLLEQLGYKTTIAPSADAALEILDEGAEFDLVFSDVMMAGDLDGLALARLLRERRPNLPVLLVTGYSHLSEAASREFALMRKPYQLPELARAVGALLVASRRTGDETNLVSLNEARPRRTRRPD